MTERMTEARFKFISDYGLPPTGNQLPLIRELFEEVKQARQAERRALQNLRLVRAIAQIYWIRLHPVKLVKKKAACG